MTNEIEQLSEQLYFSDIEKLVSAGHSVKIPIQGNSMYPFLIDGRDSVSIKEAGNISKGDIILIKTEEDQYIQIIKNATSGIIYVCTSLFFVYICKTLIDIVTNSNNKDIIIYIILLIICIILQQAVSIYNSRLTCSTETQLRNNLQSKFFTHLMTDKNYQNIRVA